MDQSKGYDRRELLRGFLSAIVVAAGVKALPASDGDPVPERHAGERIEVSFMGRHFDTGDIVEIIHGPSLGLLRVESFDATTGTFTFRKLTEDELAQRTTYARAGYRQHPTLGEVRIDPMPVFIENSVGPIRG